MTTTKIITNTIYFAGLITAIILDLDNFQFYYGIVFIAIQIVFIAAEYIITKRTIPNEALLVKKNSPFTLKDLLLVIPLIVIFFVGINLLFEWFTTPYLIAYISIGVLSAIIQFLIIKGKNTATLLIDRNNLFFNDLFLRTYDLRTLNRISFDGFDDTYTAEFANSKRITIKQDDYKQEDLNKFIAFMATKSNYNIVLSENIKNDIAAANVDIINSGQSAVPG